MQQKITIPMIENKDFKYKARGYDPEEVDNFLDDICDEMSNLLDTIDGLKRELESRTVVRPEPVEKQQTRSTVQPAQNDAASIGAMQEVLTAAVRFKEQMEAETKQKAEALLTEAQQQADDLLNNAEARANERLHTITEEHDRLSAQVESLRKAAAEYREGFLNLLKQQKEALDGAEDLFE